MRLYRFYQPDQYGTGFYRYFQTRLEAQDAAHEVGGADVHKVSLIQMEDPKMMIGWLNKQEKSAYNRFHNTWRVQPKPAQYIPGSKRLSK